MTLRRSTRLRAFNYIGLHRYFVTICTDRRATIFVEDFVLGLLSRTAVEFQFAIIAYCFMPDHLHFLVEGTTEASDFREFIRSFKQRSAFHWKRSHATTLWERSYFEHVLRDEEDTAAIAHYVVGNPVRARLVQDPKDYPYSGSQVMAFGDLLDSVRRT